MSASSAVGLALASASPSASPATHSPAIEHDTASSSAESTFSVGQAPAPAVGLPLASTSPASSTATHSVVEEHDTAVSRCPGSMLALAQPPEPGLMVLSTLPDASTATHSDVVGHDTPVSARPSSIEAGADHARVFVPTLTSACPPPSTATHCPAGAQETAFRDSPGSMLASLHDGLEDVGSLVLNTRPLLSPATHSVSERHVTALGVPLKSNAAGADQLSGDAASADAGASEDTEPEHGNQGRQPGVRAATAMRTVRGSHRLLSAIALSHQRGWSRRGPR